MPVWSVFYCMVFLISVIYTIKISPDKSITYQLSELASGIFAVSFFLIHYHILPYPPNIMIPLLMLGFILFQEIWVNRELYNLISLQNIPEEEHRFMLWFVPLTTILFLAPFVWVVMQVFKHYFSVV